MSELIVNGERREFAGMTKLPELVKALGLSPETLLIEHNGLALHRSEWNGRLLKSGDAIEIVRMTAGG